MSRGAVPLDPLGSNVKAAAISSGLSTLESIQAEPAVVPVLPRAGCNSDRPDSASTPVPKVTKIFSLPKVGAAVWGSHRQCKAGKDLSPRRVSTQVPALLGMVLGAVDRAMEAIVTPRTATIGEVDRTTGLEETLVKVDLDQIQRNRLALLALIIRRPTMVRVRRPMPLVEI
jgi:hypothetical protein